MKWNWSSGCEKAFKRVTNLLNSELSLTDYDPQIIVASEDSKRGTGTVKFEEGAVKSSRSHFKKLSFAENLVDRKVGFISDKLLQGNKKKYE